MKNLITKILTLTLVGFFAINHNANSQEFGEIFKGGPEDANTYLQNYTKPIMLSFNNGLGSGWYNTAKPHKLFGFDLTATVNIANIPQSERKFTFNPSEYQNLRIESGSDILPTAVGGDSETDLVIPASSSIGGITYENDVRFQAPPGFDAEGLPIVGFPVPAVQLGIGLPKNTELKIRYASDFGALEDDGSFNLLGFGVMHDLKQWVPGLKQMPIDVSGFMGYSSLKAEFPIAEGNAASEFEADGLAELKASSLTIQGVISKKIAIITPYLGIGYNIASSSLKVNGDFTYRDSGGEVTFTDPVDAKFTGGSSPRINAGLRLKLLILTIHAEYAIQKYNTFTAGVGLSIR
ncbi:DUF6588 family protein [Ekhidna sp.]|uniref:DUF6588 family protein n=1 Tax=Ekhidna sp. TaxID=2608089 RepID=UPI0032969202